MFTAQSLYGGPPVAAAAPVESPATDDIRGGVRALVDPNNGLFWLGVFLAVTVGAAGAAGSVRLGKAKLSAAVGS